jgi:hypothetical protein
MAMSAAHAIDVLFKTGLVLSWMYSAYHSWRYTQLLAKAQMEGTIPVDLLTARMELIWMIASRGVVPGGDVHRRKCIYGMAAFVALGAAYLLFSVLARHLS